MEKLDKLLKRVGELEETIIRQTQDNKNIIIISHLDADGITSASIVAKAIMRSRARATVRIVSDLDKSVLDALGQAGFDFYVVCDMGSGLAEQMDASLGSEWVGIDHHQIPDNEMDRSNVLNAWQFGYDGGVEICSAGLAYLLAHNMNENNIDLAWLAVVAAVADRQDQGKGRRLVELNRKIVEDAEKAGTLEVADDLIFYGRGTKPIHEALASSSSPFIPSLSGNKDAALAALTSAGLDLQDNGRWRSVSELSIEEKRKVVEAVIPYLTSSQEKDVIIEEMIGEVYTLSREDQHSQLSDAREFATLLNSCGRMKKAGIGISICMGNRGGSLGEAERILLDYRRALGNYIRSTVGVEGKVIEGGRFALVVGDGIVDEDMVGSFTSVLSSMSNFEGKIVLGKTTNKENVVKISARKTRTYDQPVNLGLFFREAATTCKGQGGGHDSAAGAKIPSSNFQQFLKILGQKLNRVP